MDWKQNTKIIKILQKQVENPKFYSTIKFVQPCTDGKHIIHRYLSNAVRASFFNSIFINFDGNPENFQAQVIEKKKTIKYNGG